MENVSHQSTVDNTDGLGMAVLELLNQANITGNTQLSYITTELTQQVTALNIAHNRTHIYSDAYAKDQACDQAWRSFYKFVEGNCYSPDPLINAPANILFGLLKQYGLGIIRKPYTDQNAGYNYVLTAIEAPNMNVSILAIPGCEQLVADFAAATAAFDAYIAKYQIDKSEEENLINATELKTVVITLINKKLIPYVEIMCTYEPAVFTSLKNGLARLISEHNEKVNRHLNSGDEQQGEDDPNSENEDPINE